MQPTNDAAAALQTAPPLCPAEYADLAALIEDFRLNETRARVAAACRNQDSRTPRGNTLPAHAAAVMLSAKWHFAAGEYAAAAPLAHQALQLAKVHGGTLLDDALALQAALWNGSGESGRVLALFAQNCQGVAAQIEYGKALSRLCRHHEAVAPLEQAAAELSQRYGVNSIAAAKAYVPLAAAYAAQGHKREALSVLSACLKNVRKHSGKNHPFIAQIHSHSAQVCAMLGNSTRAERLFHQAEQTLIARLGSRHMLLGEILAAHARFLAAEQPAAALARLQYVLMLYTDTFGSGHPAVEAAADELAQLAAAQTAPA